MNIVLILSSRTLAATVSTTSAYATLITAICPCILPCIHFCLHAPLIDMLGYILPHTPHTIVAAERVALEPHPTRAITAEEPEIPEIKCIGQGEYTHMLQGCLQSVMNATMM